MNRQPLYFLRIFSSLTLLLFVYKPGFSQIEVQPWGNIAGIRIGGQLMEFESSLSVIGKDWATVKSTGKEQQRPKYVRSNTQQIVTTTIDSFYFKQVVQDVGNGSAKIKVEVNAKEATALEGIFFNLSLPAMYYANGSMQVNSLKAVPLTRDENKLNEYFQQPVTTIAFTSTQRKLIVTFEKPTSLLIKKDATNKNEILQMYLPVQTGNAQNGQTSSVSFAIKATGTIDKKPATITINTAKTGRVFDGLGGNFRLQNANTDPQVIDYCLKNLRVAWGRVEMPWRFWQPAIDTNPTIEAKAGKLRPNVKKAMEMAQRLHKMGMPVILSAWSAPAWAIVGPPKSRPGADGVWGNPLDKTKTNEIYKSITDYIIYLKEVYGVEISMFSFNESDLGINIRQTGEEHAALIKGLGAYFVSRGLKTKLLLGDNSDATTYEFIYPALNDAATHPYIGAVSFHSWRGWQTETLQKWADAATKLNAPLIVGEGSIDAQAWGYPGIFEEQTYALEEINLYTRLLNICQPASILQWQLTADYSPLSGGGIFGDNTPLRPTQRFWNLKQLAATPEGLKAMPVSVDNKNISCAALGDNEKGVYAIHLVNNSNTRSINITGLPANIKSLRVMVTDKQRSMKEGATIPVTNGQAKLILDATSYTTLISK